MERSTGFFFRAHRFVVAAIFGYGHTSYTDSSGLSLRSDSSGFPELSPCFFRLYQFTAQQLDKALYAPGMHFGRGLDGMLVQAEVDGCQHRAQFLALGRGDLPRFDGQICELVKDVAPLPVEQRL